MKNSRKRNLQWPTYRTKRRKLIQNRLHGFQEITGNNFWRKGNFENLHILSASIAYFSVMADLSSLTSPLWSMEEKIRTNWMLKTDHAPVLLLKFFRSSDSWVSEWDWLFNVTLNDILVIYVTAHRCASGLKKKLNLRSGSQRHRHFVGFFNVPVQAPTRGYPFYTVIPRNRPIWSPFTTRWGYVGHILDLIPGSSRGVLTH